MQVALLTFIASVWYSSSFSLTKFHVALHLNTFLRDVPMELTGQLDPSKSWTVKFIYGDQEKDVVVPEDCSMLEAAEKQFSDAPSSCRKF